MCSWCFLSLLLSSYLEFLHLIVLIKIKQQFCAKLEFDTVLTAEAHRVCYHLMLMMLSKSILRKTESDLCEYRIFSSHMNITLLIND